MRFFIVLIALITVHFTSGHSSDAKVRFDGFYQTKAYVDKEDREAAYYNYLRFYPDGKVIAVSSEGTAADLKEWFNLNRDSHSSGNYEISGNRLDFSTASGVGTVIYKGRINGNDFIYLKAKSLINGYKEKKKYYFVAVPGLK